MKAVKAGPGRLTLGEDVTQCSCCKHYQGGAKAHGLPGRCPAFPDGIPEDIYLSLVDHRRAYLLGDNGIQFEQKKVRPGQPTWAEYIEAYGEPFSPNQPADIMPRGPQELPR